MSCIFLFFLCRSCFRTLVKVFPSFETPLLQRSKAFYVLALASGTYITMLYHYALTYVSTWHTLNVKIVLWACFNMALSYAAKDHKSFALCQSIAFFVVYPLVLILAYYGHVAMDETLPYGLLACSSLAWLVLILSGQKEEVKVLKKLHFNVHTDVYLAACRRRETSWMLVHAYVHTMVIAFSNAQSVEPFTLGVVLLLGVVLNVYNIYNGFFTRLNYSRPSFFVPFTWGLLLDQIYMHACTVAPLRSQKPELNGTYAYFSSRAGVTETFMMVAMMAYLIWF